MVSTRGQRAKEENETALATQLFLAEQLQQASVSKQLQHELNEAILSQQGDSQHDTSLKDGSQEDVSQPIASRQDISAEVRVEPDGNEPASDSIIVEHLDDKSRDASEIDDDTSADKTERVDGLTNIAKSVGTNVKDDDEYHPPVSGCMRQRKVGPRKTATQKATRHSQSVVIEPSSKYEGGYAFQQHNIIQDNLATGVTANQRSSGARGRKASGKPKL